MYTMESMDEFVFYFIFSFNTFGNIWIQNVVDIDF
jgi:hypothetical protein